MILKFILQRQNTDIILFKFKNFIKINKKKNFKNLKNS